jgi:hypothetical protein
MSYCFGLSSSNWSQSGGFRVAPVFLRRTARLKRIGCEIVAEACTAADGQPMLANLQLEEFIYEQPSFGDAATTSPVLIPMRLWMGVPPSATLGLRPPVGLV